MTMACAALLLSSSMLASTAAPLPRFPIAPGVSMPALSEGRDHDSGAKGVAASLEFWLRRGGEGVDTAADYRNQPEVGRAVAAAQAAGASRRSIFVTSKILGFKPSSAVCTAEGALAAVKADLKALKLSDNRLDLVLQHFPCSTAQQNQGARAAPV